MLSNYSSIAIEDSPIVKQQELFIASNIQSLEDFLKTELSVGRHVYCSFSQSQLDWGLARSLMEREIKSISFFHGQTLIRN